MSKTKIDELTIEGKTYIPKDSVVQEPKNSEIKICILQRGWVFIGRFSRDGEMCNLENAYTIRRWGTTEGLGQLALQGKQSDTTLDRAGNVTFHQLTIVAMIDCNTDAWNSILL